MSLKNAFIAGGVGALAGAAAPFVATTYLGAALLGAAANTAQYAITNYANGQPDTAGGFLLNAGTGLLGGVIGGPISAGKGLLYDVNSPFFAPGFAQYMNNLNQIEANVGLGNFARNLGGSVASNVDPTANPGPCGCH